MGSAAEANDGAVKSDASTDIPPPPGLSLIVNGVLDKPANAGSDENGNLETQRLFIEDLYVKYELGRFSVRGGKMNPGFGIASERGQRQG